MKKILIFLIFINVLLKADATVNVSGELKNIPAEDQEKLSYFFEKLIRQYGFGYTLFGDKPVSLLCWLVVPDQNKKRPYFTVNREFIEAYQVWKRHQDKFPSDQYLLADRIFCIDKEYVDLVLIQKSEFYKKVDAFPDVFPLGYTMESFMEDEILENYLNSSNQEKSNHHIRMGVLLGYGMENAVEFAKKSSGESDNSDCEDWVSFKDLINVENKNEYPFPPTFCVNPKTAETRELVGKYSYTQNKLKKILQKKEFLQIILEKYCSN